MNQKNLRSLVALVGLSLAACSSNPYKVKEVDTQIDTKAAYQGQKIGLDDKKQVVIQQETAPDVELRNLSWKEYDLEQKIHSDHELLTRCREEIADPRLGGSGNVTDIPEVDTLKTPSQVKDEMGITQNGNLSIVKREMYLDRLNTERQYVDALTQQQRVIQKNKDKCDHDYKIARVKHGLSAERYVGKGYYKDGHYVQTRAAENNLDDAFAIASKESQAAQAAKGKEDSAESKE